MSNKKSKSVFCVELNQKFKSISVAAKKLEINVSGVCVAIRSGGTCGGYHWKYVEDEK